MSVPASVVATLDSKLESVETFEGMVREFSRESGFEDEDQYFIELAAREIVINAIKHGNRFDPGKKVEVSLARDQEYMTIEVRDEGDGFRLDDVPDPRAPENQQKRSGRGIAMTLAIMDEFFVEKNRPHGTHIRMLKALPKA
jgi:serine/threonine-protein kinase RsbW